MNDNDYFEGMNFKKIILVIMFIFCMMALFQELKGEDNKSLELDTSKTGWPTQVIWNSVNACQQGTHRWIVMSNPALIGIPPPPQTQMAMIEHCFCVLDRVRNLYSFMQYLVIVPNQSSIGQLYYDSAMKCVTENGTLSGIIRLEPKDNTTKSDNETIIKPLEEKPKEEPEEKLESPFQG